MKGWGATKAKRYNYLLKKAEIRKEGHLSLFTFRYPNFIEYLYNVNLY